MAKSSRMPIRALETTVRLPSRRAALVIVGLLVLLGCAARLIHLDADPHFPTWISYVVDEGRWSESARNLALFGTPDAFAERIHLLLSPAYQLGNYIAFKLFGVNFMTARASAAIAGTLVVLTVFIALRHHVTAFALGLGVIILGFETNMLVESRLALPEIPSVLASLFAFFVLALLRKTKRNACLAGAMVAASVALKGTSALVAPAFLLVVLLSLEGEPLQARIVRAFCLVSGAALPIVAGLGIGLALGVVGVENMTRAGADLLKFTALAYPRSALWAFFDSPGHGARNLILLGAWFCSWLWFHRGPSTPPIVRGIYLASGVWAGWCLLVWSANFYSPGRYVVHAIVPGTIHVMAGLSLADQNTPARIASGFRQRSKLTQVVLLTWLVFPTAIIVGMALASLAALAGWDVSRVSARIALIFASIALLALAAYRNSAREGVIAGFLIAPVSATLLWLAGFEFHVFRHFWEFDSAAAIRLWLGVAGSAIAASFWLALRGGAAQRHAITRAFVIVVLAVPLLFQAALPVFAPTYTIRDASRDLGRQLSPVAEIRVESAASIFLENTLRYREPPLNDKRYDVLVVFEHNVRSQRLLRSPDARSLVRILTYPLKIDSRYEFDENKDGPAQIAVFRSK